VAGQSSFLSHPSPCLRSALEYRLCRFVGICFLLVHFTACLRVGIPEYVSSGAVIESRVGRPSGAARLETYLSRLGQHEPSAALLVHPQPADWGTPTVGHQYLLGFIPFTSVFLQHGAGIFFDEVATDVLRENGYQVLAVNEGARHLLPLLRPELVLQTGVKDFRLNGFDAIFFRIVTLRGELTADFFSGDGAHLLLSEKRPLEETDYRKFAYPPILSSAAERTLRREFRSLLRTVPKVRQSIAAVTDAAQADGSAEQSPRAPLLIFFPRFLNPPPVGLGRFVADSYGYESFAPFSNHALLRLIQRGIEGGVETSGGSLISLRGGREQGSQAWSALQDLPDLRSIEVEIQSLVVQEQPVAGIAYQLRLVVHRRGGIPQIFDCSGLQREAEHMDGAWAVSLERIGRRAVAAADGDVAACSGESG
jgi:hypothetical protein